MIGEKKMSKDLKDLFNQSKKLMNDKIKNISKGEIKEIKKNVERRIEHKEIIQKEEKEETLILSEMKYEELYQLAKDKNLKGFSAFNKEDLISFLEKELGFTKTKIQENKEEEIIFPLRKKEHKERNSSRRREEKIDLTGIIPYDEQILLSSENSRGYKQLEIIKKKIRECPSLKEAYIKWANEVIIFEGANK